MSDNTGSCQCSGGPKMIFACSGAADVGELSDAVARKMTRESIAKMSCLAGIGGRVGGVMKMAEVASQILAIDGCSGACAKHCLEQAGFENFEHLRLADLGMIKGETEVSEENIDRAVIAASEKIQMH